MMQIEQSVLDNGLRVLTARLPGFESAAVAAFVHAGSRYEAEANGGVAHFLEHMAFKGTRSRSALQIATEIECLGASVNAYTSRDVTAYYVTGLGSTVPSAVAILGDVLTASVFDPAEIATEKGVILQEIKRHSDNPSGVASDGFSRIAFPDQPLGRPILGAPQVVAALDRADLAAFVGRHYFARNMVVVGAGNIDHAAFADLVARHFSALPAGAEPAPPAPATYVGGFFRDTERDFQQVTMLLGFGSVPDTDPAVHAHGLLAAALGGGMSSPLFQQVREKRGLVYAVQSWSEHGSDFGLLSVYAGTTAEHVAEVLRVTCGEIAGAARQIDEADLMRARNGRLVQLATARESPFGIARGIAWSLFTFGRIVMPEELMEQVRAVSLDDVRDAAGAIIATPPTLSLVGPVTDADPLALVRSALCP